MSTAVDLRREVTSLLSDLVRLETVNPPGNETRVAAHLRAYLEAAGLACELLAPALLAPETLRDATAVQFPGLAGVLPGFGRQDPNDWGLGFELRDAKSPHWTGSRNSPSTFGHFGRSGTFLWVDPDARAALVVLTDREFGDWAKSAWPAVSDATLAELASAR